MIEGVDNKYLMTKINQDERFTRVGSMTISDADYIHSQYSIPKTKHHSHNHIGSVRTD